MILLVKVSHDVSAEELKACLYVRTSILAWLYTYMHGHVCLSVSFADDPMPCYVRGVVIHLPTLLSSKQLRMGNDEKEEEHTYILTYLPTHIISIGGFVCVLASRYVSTEYMR